LLGVTAEALQAKTD